MTSNAGKTRSELLEDIRELRQRIAQLEAAETARDTDELREGDCLLSTIFNNTSDLQIVVGVEPNGEFRVRAVNRAYLDAANRFGLNMKRENSIGLTLEEIVLNVLGVDQQRLDDILAKYRLVVESGKPMEYTESAVVMDQPYHSRVRLSPIPDFQGICRYVLYTAHDITEQKLAEEALKKSQTELSKIQKAAGIGGWEWELASNTIVWADEVIYDILGIDHKIALNAELAEKSIHPEDVKRVWHADLEAMTHQTPLEMEYRIIRPDGTVRWVLAKGIFDVDANNAPVHYIGTIQDITERKQAELRLKRSEARFRRLAENAPVIIYRYQLVPDPKFDYVNPIVTQITGYSPEDHYANPNLGFELVHPDDRDLLRSALEDSNWRPLTLRWVHKNGAVIWTEQHNIPIYDEHGALIAIEGIASDVTARKVAEEHLEETVEIRTTALQHAQEQLLRREKLAVLGQLAGSVAHELRHPLGILANAAYFLKMSLSEATDMTREYLDIISTEVRRSDKIISDLLSFSQNRPSQSESATRVRVSDAVAGVMAEQPPPDGITPAIEEQPEGAEALVDEQHLRQILTNLVLNAYQAMPDGGTLSVITRRDGEQIRIAVADTGGGIAPEHLNKLFEPLFTTKPKGIGLGLAISKNLIEANGGAIGVESEEGQGTTFTLVLPCEEDIS
jgi:PAS domain S-box-containing protein